MEMKLKTNKKKKWLLTGLLVPILTVILLLLAERYLIHHVVISDVSAYAATSNTVEVSPTTSDPTSAAADSTSVTTSTVSDDWNYSDGSVSIAVTKHVTGSGSNQVTYFVADVQLTDATQLQSAFADNQFGRNITADTSEIAAENDAIFAINGDYYGFRTDGIIIRNGVVYRDVPARMGLAFYRDGSMQVYDETQTSAQELLDAGVWNTLSFGPALLEHGQVVDNSGVVTVDNNIGNHPIQGQQPRTGIGIIDTNHFVFVVVDGRSTGYSRGVTLAEFSQLFKGLGCTTAYNIDGGGSSTMYFQGRVVNNPLGRNQERGTSDILYIGE